MNARTLAKKVKLLKAGQIVEINGLLFRAKKVNANDWRFPCDYCNVDCICKGDITKICIELDFLSKYDWYLNIESTSTN